MRRIRSLRLVGLSLWVLGPAMAAAHHSFGNIYDQSQDQRLVGVVKEFRFVHPHPMLVVAVTDSAGAKAEWRAEMDNRFELEEIGMLATTFKPGDQVILNGSPGRSQPNILYLRKLQRPADGLRYEQIGSTPYLNPGRR